MTNGEFPHPVSNAVLKIIHKITFFNIKHLIKCAWNMEADSVHLIIAYILAYFILCKPTLVGKTEFKFVAVSQSLFATQYG